jgi:hypothetical protein
MLFPVTFRFGVQDVGYHRGQRGRHDDQGKKNDDNEDYCVHVPPTLHFFLHHLFPAGLMIIPPLETMPGSSSYNYFMIKP